MIADRSLPRAVRRLAPPRIFLAAAALALLLLPAGAAPAPPGRAPAASSGPGAAGSASAAGWMEVDYAALVDTRRLTHSGESVGMVLHQLGGRPYPAPGEGGQDDATAYSLPCRQRDASPKPAHGLNDTY